MGSEKINRKKENKHKYKSDIRKKDRQREGKEQAKVWEKEMEKGKQTEKREQAQIYKCEIRKTDRQSERNQAEI
jgi:hypothetical protein